MNAFERAAFEAFQEGYTQGDLEIALHEVWETYESKELEDEHL